MVYPILRGLLDSHPCPDEEMIAEKPAHEELVRWRIFVEMRVVIFDAGSPDRGSQRVLRDPDSHSCLKNPLCTKLT